MSALFKMALEAAGLMPRDVVADGKIRRCRTQSKAGKQNGWYVLHPEGHGSWGDWTTGSGEALGHWRDESASHIAPSAATLEKIAEQRKREREARIRAIRGARAFWAAADPLRSLHPYLEKKGLSALGCIALKQKDGALLIPVIDAGGSLISIQSITPDGDKRFWPGAPVKAGCFKLIREKSSMTAVVEGLATGLAVYQSVRLASVIVAFDAGNLAPVVQQHKLTGSVVICADNDHGTMARRGFNPGLDKANNAAELIGAGVAYPEGIEGTDFCDWLKEEGPNGARKIERLIQAQAKYVIGPSMP